MCESPVLCSVLPVSQGLSTLLNTWFSKEYCYGGQCDMCLARSELLERQESVHAVVCHNCFSLEVHASFCTEATSSYSKLPVGNSLPLHYYASGEVFYRAVRFVQALSSCCSFCWLKRSLPASHKCLQICQVSGLHLLCDCLGSSRARLVVNSMSNGSLPGWSVS